MRGLGAFAAVACLLAACGSGADSRGGGGNQPTIHTLASNDPNDLPADQALAIGPFSVPTGAIVDYSIVDTPTGFGSDTMTVAVVTDASLNGGGQLVAYGVKEDVSSTSGSTPPLPAGSYDFLIECHNLIDDCIFNVTLSATY